MEVITDTTHFTCWRHIYAQYRVCLVQTGEGELACLHTDTVDVECRLVRLCIGSVQHDTGSSLDEVTLQHLGYEREAARTRNPIRLMSGRLRMPVLLRSTVFLTTTMSGLMPTCKPWTGSWTNWKSIGQSYKRQNTAAVCAGKDGKKKMRNLTAPHLFLFSIFYSFSKSSIMDCKFAMSQYWLYPPL